MNAIKFYNVVWDTKTGQYKNTTEASHNRRYLTDMIRKGEIKYDTNGTQWAMLKIQELETPMIDMNFIIDLFTTGSTKKNREACKDQAAYVIRLIEACALRVTLEDGRVIER